MYELSLESRTEQVYLGSWMLVSMFLRRITYYADVKINDNTQLLTYVAEDSFTNQ